MPGAGRTRRGFDGALAMKRALVLCVALICTVPAAERAVAHGDDDARPERELGVIPVHGDYDWIRRGNYRNQSGEACCGRDDCSVVARERIRAGADGFVLLGRRMSVKRGEALPSEDGQFWLCTHPDGRLRCFFVPPEM